MAKSKSGYGRSVYIVDGARAPFLKAKGQVGPFTASDLAFGACRDLLARLPFEPSDIDEVIAGCVMPTPDEMNIGRILALRLGCGNDVPGWTVQRNCASGMQALDNAAQDIAMGRHDLVLAGGMDAMSYAPILLSEGLVNRLADWNSAKNFPQKLQSLTKLKLRVFIVYISIFSVQWNNFMHFTAFDG